MGLPRELRLRSRRRIGEVIRRGRRAQSGIGSLHALRRETPDAAAAAGARATSRLAQAFPRRLGTAVARNRTRRRVQEHFRTREPAYLGAWDIVFRARPAALAADFAELGRGLDELLQRVGVLRSSGDVRSAPDHGSDDGTA